MMVLSSFAAPASAQERSDAWGYNSFGVPGMIDMPTAFGREDAEFAFTSSHVQNQTRNTLTFQASERLSASLRYALLYDVRYAPDSDPFLFLFDRSFSLQYRVLDERRYLPAVAIGINDIIGTGIYSGEYLVASKTISPRLRATAGLGWGRLGSKGGFSNPLTGVFGDAFGSRPSLLFGAGGKFDPDQWFKGDAAIFGGVEWQATDALRMTAEYSSDDYGREDGAAFHYRSPVNFGVSYQFNDRISVDARYLYGSEIGVQFTYAVNPMSPRFGSGIEPAPPPVLRRDDAPPAQNEASFAISASRALTQEGITLAGVQLDAKVLRIQVENTRYGTSAQALGRAARVLTRLAPVQIDTFDIRLASMGVPVTSIVMQRSDIEDLEFHPVAPDLLRSKTRIVDMTSRLSAVDGRYLALNYGLQPYIATSLFDPDKPVLADFGLALDVQYAPRPGIVLSGILHQKIAGNLDSGTRTSTSVLPRVRSEAYLFYKGSDTTVPELTAAYYFRPGQDFFGRATVGYLERMFGGVSAEVLWKPQNSRLALGAEMNYVKQRDFDQMLGFATYETFTGHLSAYYDIGRGYQAQVDVGQYLAGDLGATFSVARTFDNGWRIGAFATLTDTSFEDFGEGSFDKGIEITIPLDWVTGQASKTRLSSVLRPVLRDGGARLNVSGRLYDPVRTLQATELDATWGRFWR